MVCGAGKKKEGGEKATGLTLLIYTSGANVLMWVCFLENPPGLEATVPRLIRPQPVGGQDGGNGQVLTPEKAERTGRKGKENPANWPTA